MNRRVVLAAAVVAVLLASVGIAAAATTSIWSSDTELDNGTLTNLQIVGSGDDAYADFVPPDKDITTDTEFNNGTLTNFSVQGSGESANLFDDLLVVGSQHTTDTDFNNADELTNVTVEGSGNGASVVLPTGTTTLIDGFEDGDITEWNGDTGEASAQQTIVQDGAWAMTINAPGDGDFEELNRSLPDKNIDNISIAMRDGDVNDGGSASPALKYMNNSNELMIWLAVGDGSFSGISQGELLYRDAALNRKGTGIILENDTWYDVTIHDVDFVNDNAQVTVRNASQGEIGTSQIELFGDQSESAAWHKVKLQGEAEQSWFDSLNRTTIGDPKGTYKSQNLTVENAEQANINVTVTNGAIDGRVEFWDGSAWQSANDFNLTTTDNHTLDISGHASQTKWQVNATFKNLSGTTTVELHDESILSTHRANYTSPTRSLSPTGGYIDITLSGTNITAKWEGKNTSESTWTQITTQDESATGNHSVSFGDTYDEYRAILNATYDSGSTGEVTVHEIGWTGPTDGGYTGDTHDLQNASTGLIALDLANATANVTMEGSDDESSWSVVNKTNFTSSVDLFELDLSGNYSHYRTIVNFSTRAGPTTAELHAEGVSGSSVVNEITQVSGGTSLLTALANSPESIASADSLLETISVLQSKTGASIDRLVYRLRVRAGLISDTQSVEQRMTAAEEFYNDKDDAFTAFVNTQIADETVNLTDWDTVEIEMHSVSGNATTTRYWICLVDGDSCATTIVVNDTTRTVDKRLVVKDYATYNSLRELQTFFDEFVIENKVPTTEYVAKLSGRYGPDLTGSAINATS